MLDWLKSCRQGSSSVPTVPDTLQILGPQILTDSQTLADSWCVTAFRDRLQHSFLGLGLMVQNRLYFMCFKSTYWSSIHSTWITSWFLLSLSISQTQPFCCPARSLCLLRGVEWQWQTSIPEDRSTFTAIQVSRFGAMSWPPVSTRHSRTGALLSHSVSVSWVYIILSLSSFLSKYSIFLFAEHEQINQQTVSHSSFSKIYWHLKPCKLLYLNLSSLKKKIQYTPEINSKSINKTPKWMKLDVSLKITGKCLLSFWLLWW